MPQEIEALRIHGTLAVPAVGSGESVNATVPDGEVWEPRSYVVELASGSPSGLRQRVIALPAGGVGTTLYEGEVTWDWAEEADAISRAAGVGVWGAGDIIQWQFWQETGTEEVELRYLVSGRKYVQRG